MTNHDEETPGHGHSAEPAATPSATPVLIGIALVIGIWSALTVFGFNDPVVRGAGHGETHPPAATGHDPAHPDPAALPTTPDSVESDHKVMPDYYAIAPFVMLLGAIAIFPLLASMEHFWEDNKNKLIVAGILAVATLLYYGFLYADAGLHTVVHILEHSILSEYIPFIVLLFSLFTISGGIRIEGDLAARPSTNATFMAIGAVLASFVGTTGAAMLLIRPLLETNRERHHVAHTVVFFIFTVCNTGGCLLPIGDPPLFLGYLQGVDFLWTFFALWAPWLVTNVLIIAVYYVWDAYFCYPQETKADIQLDESQIRPLTIRGLEVNLPLLLGVILSVALLDPSKTFLGTNWQPWIYLREVVQLLLIGVSLALGSAQVRKDNGFNYHAIVEVAALFIGIFITMQPALQILNIQGPKLGLDHPLALFWATGTLSSVLDNAPTYLVFYQATDSAFPGVHLAELLHEASARGELANERLVGISLGAVFMGAMTYIGNGPNFMVRAIAEQSGVKMPSFFGYCFQYSLPVLLPIFAIVSVAFLLLFA